MDDLSDGVFFPGNTMPKELVGSTLHRLLFDDQETHRRDALKKFLSLVNRSVPPHQRDWPTFVSICSSICERLYSPRSSYELEGFECFELLAKAYRESEMELDYLERTTFGPSRQPKIVQSLLELKERAGKHDLYIPLLDNKTSSVRCLGCFCLSCLPSQNSVIERLSLALESETERIAKAGLLGLTATWNILADQRRSYLDSPDLWLRRFAAYTIYTGNFPPSGIPFITQAFDLIDDVEQKPELWDLPGWGLPYFEKIR